TFSTRSLTISSNRGVRSSPGAKLSISTSVPFAASWIRQSRGQKVCSRMNSVSTATKGAWPSLTQASASSSLREISFMEGGYSPSARERPRALSVRVLGLRLVGPKRAANREQRQRDRDPPRAPAECAACGSNLRETTPPSKLPQHRRGHHAVNRRLSLLLEARHDTARSRAVHEGRHNRTERDESGESPNGEGRSGLA